MVGDMQDATKLVDYLSDVVRESGTGKCCASCLHVAKAAVKTSLQCEFAQKKSRMYHVDVRILMIVINKYDKTQQTQMNTDSVADPAVRPHPPESQCVATDVGTRQVALLASFRQARSACVQGRQQQTRPTSQQQRTAKENTRPNEHEKPGAATTRQHPTASTALTPSVKTET